MAWCEKELGVVVSYKKLHYWFRRWGYRKKVPQPMAEKKARGRGGVCR
jgi:hypothetical protein